MAQVYAIGSSRSLNRAVMHCECHSVTLAERNDFWTRLHARTLLGEHKLAAREISLWFTQQDCYLYGEDVLPVEILMQAIVVACAVPEKQWRWSLLACVVTSLEKCVVSLWVAGLNRHGGISAIRDRR